MVLPCFVSVCQKRRVLTCLAGALRFAALASLMFSIYPCVPSRYVPLKNELFTCLCWGRPLGDHRFARRWSSKGHVVLGPPKSTKAIVFLGVSNANSEQDTAICMGFWVLFWRMYWYLQCLSNMLAKDMVLAVLRRSICFKKCCFERNVGNFSCQSSSAGQQVFTATLPKAKYGKIPKLCKKI